MPTTPKLAIPYANASDDLRDYPTLTDKPQAQRIEDLWFPSWVTLAGPLTGTCKYKVIGSLILIAVDGGVSMTTGVTVTLNTTPLPAALRAPFTIRAACEVGNGAAGQLWTSTDGLVNVRQGSGATKTNVVGTLIYPYG